MAVRHARMRRLFFYCHDDHHDLHSFPTRTLFRSLDVAGKGLPAALLMTLLRGSLRSLLSAGLDRKSTRLNSSHTVISYAVFCLKKKRYDDQLVDRIRVEDTLATALISATITRRSL